ncbi:MAG: cupin domain-containing protein [Chloroflexi bacterium]|nr:MAG: cupin domain-containing protein [Chloroflexota bacterium]
MPQKVQSIAEAADRLTKPFTHTVIGQVDDYCAYLSRFQGSYRFHKHDKDEMYLVLEGEINIDYPDGQCVTLRERESIVVKAGETHRSRSEEESLVLMFKAHDLFAE